MSSRISVLAIATVIGCGGIDDPREAEIASVLAKADEPLIRARALLTAGKYALMAANPYAFFRGTMPVWRHDWEIATLGLSTSAFGLDAPMPLSIGDAHPENFGTLRAADGTFALEPNDLDAADRAPYLWDVRRLCVGMYVSAALSNGDDPTARATALGRGRDVARAAARAYADEIDALAGGAPRARMDDPGSEAIVADLFDRSQGDAEDREELGELTEHEGTSRRLKRGVLDPVEPTNGLADLPAFASAALPQALAAWRETLVAPPPSEQLVILDAARQFGSGVASWPRIRALVLVRGPTDDPADDLVLELKELPESGVGGWIPPGVYADSVGARVLATSRRAWARPDAEPFWGVTTWVGLECQVRLESEGNKTLRVRRFVAELGEPDALIELAARLGRLVARVHASPFASQGGAAGPIAAAIGDARDAFADEQADVAARYAPLVLEDRVRFGRALAHLGPRLGVPEDTSDEPRADLAALCGAPFDGPPQTE